MGLFGKRKDTVVVTHSGSVPVGVGGMDAYLSGGGADRSVGRWTGPTASNATGLDVFRTIDEAWGRRQTLLGYSDRVRCEQADASGWEFHRGASFAADASRRLTEDDTTLQVVALFGPYTPVRWDDLRRSYPDVNHQDFGQLGEARFTATDATGAPICVFRVRTMAVRIRMTGTLANRQYTRVYALDVFHHIDVAALGMWLNAVERI
jgi:hypothetical protein